MSRPVTSRLSSQEESVLEEIEALKSIFINELDVIYGESGRPTQVSVNLTPATADDFEAQFVCLTLVLTVNTEYPQVLPDIVVRNPRGLSDAQLYNIKTDLEKTAGSRKGGQMMYELIQLAKDHLTSSNTPTGQCAICLYGFNKTDVFTKTKCYHHFHTHCLGRYVKSALDIIREEEEEGFTHNPLVKKQKKEVVCPVCREPIHFDLAALISAPPPSAHEADQEFHVTPQLAAKQQEMLNLYQTQKARGGIIDVEEEKKKFLIQISQMSRSGESTAPAENSETSEQETPDFTQVYVIKKESTNVTSSLPRESTTDQQQGNSSNRQRWENKPDRKQLGTNYRQQFMEISNVTDWATQCDEAQLKETNNLWSPQHSNQLARRGRFVPQERRGPPFYNKQEDYGNQRQSRSENFHRCGDNYGRQENYNRGDNYRQDNYNRQESYNRGDNRQDGYRRGGPPMRGGWRGGAGPPLLPYPPNNNRPTSNRYDQNQFPRDDYGRTIDQVCDSVSAMNMNKGQNRSRDTTSGRNSQPYSLQSERYQAQSDRNRNDHHQRSPKKQQNSSPKGNKESPHLKSRSNTNSIAGFRKGGKGGANIPAFSSSKVIQEPIITTGPRAFGPPPCGFKSSDDSKNTNVISGQLTTDSSSSSSTCTKAAFPNRPAFVKPKPPPGFSSS